MKELPGPVSAPVAAPESNAVNGVPPELQALGSIPWRGRSLARLADVYVRIEARRAPHATDWWIFGVPPLALIHIVLFVALWVRPGPMGPVLWRWGPPIVAIGVGVLLLAALWSALWNRLTWSARRVTAYVGLTTLALTVTQYQAYPSSYDDAPSPVRFQLPMNGPVTVAWGGDSLGVNYHVSVPAERWAYDLLIARDGVSHRSDGRTLTDYYAYDQPVRSPAEGRIIAVHDGEADTLPGRQGRGRGAGNHVIIEVARGQYLLIAHLRRGSITVAPGERVRAGEGVGSVGNSGHTTEPHVHLHLQDTPIANTGEGIPLYFSDYKIVKTGRRIDRGMPRGGFERGRFVGDVVASMR